MKKILNHMDRDVTAIYDRYSYDREKRAALKAWAKRVDAIVSGTCDSEHVVGVAPVVPASRLIAFVRPAPVSFRRQRYRVLCLARPL